MNLIPLGTRPANPARAFESPPVPIPTQFARYHAAITSCDRIDDLVDTVMRTVLGTDSIPAFAEAQLVVAADRRFAEIRAQERAA